MVWLSVHQNPVHVVMKARVLMVLMGTVLIAAPAFAQQKTVTGKVTDEQGAPLSGVSVVIKGTNRGTSTNGVGFYSLRAATGDVLRYRYLGTLPVERVVTSTVLLGDAPGAFERLASGGADEIKVLVDQ